MLSAKLTNKIRKAVYKRDDFMCALCGSNRGIQIHHVVPRGRGGSNSLHNLITLCNVCHANAHGNMMELSPHTREEVEQHMVEYLADIYLEDFTPDWLIPREWQHLPTTITEETTEQQTFN